MRGGACSGSCDQVPACWCDARGTCIARSCGGDSDRGWEPGRRGTSSEIDVELSSDLCDCVCVVVTCTHVRLHISPGSKVVPRALLTEWERALGSYVGAAPRVARAHRSAQSAPAHKHFHHTLSLILYWALGQRRGAAGVSDAAQGGAWRGVLAAWAGPYGYAGMDRTELGGDPDREQAGFWAWAMSYVGFYIQRGHALQQKRWRLVEQRWRRRQRFQLRWEVEQLWRPGAPVGAVILSAVPPSESGVMWRPRASCQADRGVDACVGGRAAAQSWAKRREH